MPARRFPPPWSVDVTPNCFIVRDANGQQIAYVYYECEPGRQSAAKLLSKDEARRIASNIAKLPVLLKQAKSGLCCVMLPRLGRIRHANINESRLGAWLCWCIRVCCGHACPRSVLLPATSGLRLRLRTRLSDLEWMPAGLDSSGRKLRPIPRSGWWRMAHMERLPARIHHTGRKLRPIPRSHWSRPAAGAPWLDI